MLATSSFIYSVVRRIYYNLLLTENKSKSKSTSTNEMFYSDISDETYQLNKQNIIVDIEQEIKDFPHFFTKFDRFVLNNNYFYYFIITCKNFNELMQFIENTYTIFTTCKNQGKLVDDSAYKKTQPAPYNSVTCVKHTPITYIASILEKASSTNILKAKKKYNALHTHPIENTTKFLLKSAEDFIITINDILENICIRDGTCRKHLVNREKVIKTSKETKKEIAIKLVNFFKNGAYVSGYMHNKFKLSVEDSNIINMYVIILIISSKILK